VSEARPYLCERIREALAHDPRVGSLDIEVAMIGDTITIGGHVTTEARRGAVPAVVAELVPDRRVVNETVVFGEPDPPSVEEL
jgi:hypothetical protein